MAKGSFNNIEIIRILDRMAQYPAVMVPAMEGGYEVVLTNFPDAIAYGVKRETALKAASEMLTAEILTRIKQHVEPPKASDPKNLHPDPDEPAGTELVMLEPDMSILRKHLGLEQKKRSDAISALGLYGKK